MTVPWDPPFLYRNQPYEAAELLNRLQQDSKLPLLIAADFERGVTMRLHGATEFPHAMAFGAAGKLEYAEAFGRITAQEARAVGVHWNFFPDADVNSNPANPIINTRSFGEDPQQVGDLVTAYIRGARANGMMTTVKHFPGHGDTATDSHLGVAQVTGDMTRLKSVELPPFQKAIEAGVDSVMVAHVSVPALDSDPNHVATTSPAIVTGLLKNQLGFKGIVVTDALDMAGLTRLYGAHIGRAAVDAFKAGNDVLLIPADLDASYRAMLEAVRSGEIPRAQLDASVLKILKAKASLTLHKTRLVNVEAVSSLVGKPENLALGQQIADDSITLVRDNGKLLPLKSSGTTAAGLPYQRVEEVRDNMVAVIFSDDMRTEAGRTLERQIRDRVADANVIYVDPRVAAVMADDVLKAVDNATVGDCRSVRSPGGRESDERRKRCDQLGRPVRRERRPIAEGTRSRRRENGRARHGKPVPGAGLPGSPKLSVHVFQCDGFGSGRGESVVRRNCDPGTSAGQHPEHRAARRRDRASRANRARRFSTC